MHRALLTGEGKSTSPRTSPPPTLPGTMRVANVERGAEDVLVVRLNDPDGRELSEWEPGAHLEVRLGNHLLRHYSLCGDVDDRETYQIAVLRERNGRGGSDWIHEHLVEGATLEVTALRNRFRLSPAQEYVFVAGGIGITPILPMVRAAERSRIPWSLTYGGRTRASMAFLEELAALDGASGRLRVLPQDQHGLLPLAELLNEPRPGAAIYACGPDPLLAVVEEVSAGWPDGSVHMERFRISDAASREVTPPDDGDQPVELVCARSGRTLLVPADTSLLDAVLEAGISKDFSCREGNCGTCETAVLEGLPDHRDEILDDDERSANDTMMICVSRARTGRLVLDL